MNPMLSFEDDSYAFTVHILKSLHDTLFPFSVQTSVEIIHGSSARELSYCYFVRIKFDYDRHHIGLSMYVINDSAVANIPHE